MLKVSLNSSYDLISNGWIEFIQISVLHLGPGTRKGSPVWRHRDTWSQNPTTEVHYQFPRRTFGTCAVSPAEEQWSPIDSFHWSFPQNLENVEIHSALQGVSLDVGQQLSLLLPWLRGLSGNYFQNQWSHHQQTTSKIHPCSSKKCKHGAIVRHNSLQARCLWGWKQI